MRINFRRRSTLLIGAGAFLLLSTPAFALFGFGDIVFDPSVYGQALAEVKQAIQMVSTAKAQFAAIQANLKSFSFKELWRTAYGQISNESVPNRYGETAGWNVALNTNSPTAAVTAWNMANVSVSANTAAYFGGQLPGNSGSLASLAMVEAFDSSSPNCLNAIAKYRVQRTQNATAEANLQNEELDTSSATNSEVEQLNMLNAAEAQRMTEMQSQGELHSCLATQMTIANMAQRNAAATAINDAAFVQVQRAANPTFAGNSSETWTSYVP